MARLPGLCSHLRRPCTETPSATQRAEDALPIPISPYGVTKLSSEQLVMAYRRSTGLDARCVRYFTVYGPRQRPDMAFARFIAAALDGGNCGGLR